MSSSFTDSTTSLSPGEARAALVDDRSWSASEKPVSTPDPTSAQSEDQSVQHTSGESVSPKKKPTDSMDHWKQKAVKARGAVDVSTAGEASRCPHCALLFKTFAGRRLHERRAHPLLYFADVQHLAEQKTKARWSDEERRLIARAEVEFKGPAKDLYAHLCAVLPNRSRDSIKAMRNKHKIYKTFLEEAGQELRAAQVSATEVSTAQVSAAEVNTATTAQPEMGGAARPKFTRWTEDERRRVAQAEAVFDGPSKNLYAHLCLAVPGRSKESVKGMRLKSKGYRELVQELKHEPPRSVTPGVVLQVTSTSPDETSISNDVNIENPEPDESHTSKAQPEDWRTKLEAIIGGKATKAYSCLANRNRTERLFARWMSKFTTTMTDKKIQRSVPKIVGNRAQRRRKLRAAWLGAYERNPARTAKLVLDGQHLNNCSTFPTGTPEFWKDLYERESTPWNQRANAQMKESTQHSDLLKPFTESEVGNHIKTMKAGAAGCDNINLTTLRKINITELVEWFNLFLFQGMLPRCLKRFRTTLIPKVTSPSQPSEYRPISVGSFVRRLFCGMMAKRMNSVETDYCQKGFKKIEGCAIQSYTLRAIVDHHIQHKKSLSYVFMDVKKAFDSVSHDALRKAYIKADLPAGLITLLEDMYVNNTTILSADPNRNLIKLRRGVLQGDPLSPVLFNLVMDDVVSGLSPHYGAELGTGTKITNLLFADDAVLFGETTEGLQKNVDTFIQRMATFGLEVNAKKCAAVHIRVDGKRKKWYVAKDIPLTAGLDQVKSLKIGESYKYLGLSLNVKSGVLNAEQDLKRMLNNLSASVLKPQQRLHILKTNIVPRLLYETGLEFRTDCALNDLDIRIRKEIRRWLHLPKDVPTPFFHAEVKDGGLGVPNLRTRIPRLQNDRFERITKMKNPDPYVDALRNSTYWRKQLQGTQDSLGRIGILDKTSERNHWKRNLYGTIDGSGLSNHSNNSGYKSKWLADPSFLKLTGREFVGAIHVRANSLYTKERATRGRITNRGRNCPCCPDRRESLAHILQVCWRTQSLRIFRHDNIMKMLENKLKKLGYQVVKEPRIPVGRSFLKPDLVAVDIKKKTTTIIDPSIVATSRNLVLAEKDKTDKYNNSDVAKWATKKFGEGDVRVFGAIVDWRGAWAPRSWTSLKWMGLSPSFMELISFKILRLSRYIYSCLRDRTDG